MSVKRIRDSACDIPQSEAKKLGGTVRPVSTIGSAISTHAGPGAIAVAFFSRE